MISAFYKLDNNDSGLPGLARVEVIKRGRLILVESKMLGIFTEEDLKK